MPRGLALARGGHSGLAVLSLLLGAGAFGGFILLGDRTPVDLLAALVASLAAAAIVILVVRMPVGAFGLLLLLATISRWVIDLPVGRVRLEQPAVIAALVTLALTHGWPRWSLVRPVLPIAASFVVYLVVLTLASVLYAPQPTVSARLIIWTVLSMAAGVVVFSLLTRPDTKDVEAWFTATGVFHAIIGLGIAGAFLVLGPKGIPGMQVSPGEPPKVAGLAFEANLYASMLGALAPFAIERFRTRPSIWTAAAAIVIIASVGLGVTRGAYIGLAAGLLAYLAVLAVRTRARSALATAIPVLVVGLLLAPSVAYVTLTAERPAAVQPTLGIEPTPGTGETTSPSQTEVPSTMQPAPTSTPEPTPTANTLAFRLDRVPTALKDIKTSPLIGLGAASFGQRHELPDNPGTPDYIGILALVAVYESGIIGAAALAIGFLLALGVMFRASRRLPGASAAFIASLVVLLVAYEATNALFFSINWIILGAGLAMAMRPGDMRGRSVEPDS